MAWSTDYNPDEFRDPISKKWMTQLEWKKKYGDGRLAALLYAYNSSGQQIPPAVLTEIMEVGIKYEQEMREKFKPRVVRKETTKVKEQTLPEVKEQEWFAKVDAKIVENMKRSDCHRNPTGLLLILLLHRSWRGKKDKHKTWYHWHQERKLIVSSISKTKLAELMGVSLSTIYRYTNRLVENGDIRVEIENGENVYVLGFIDETGKEVFYYTQADNDRGCQNCEKDMSELTHS
jgi:Helix-turn-helix domain of resolvase